MNEIKNVVGFVENYTVSEKRLISIDYCRRQNIREISSQLHTENWQKKWQYINAALGCI